MGAGFPGARRIDRPVARLGACRELWRRGAGCRHDGAFRRSYSRRQPWRDRDPDRYRRKAAGRRRTLWPPRDAYPRDRAQPGLLTREAQGSAEALGRDPLELRLEAFSSREPVSTSLENALIARGLISARLWRRRGRRE